jgi:hypothetical protein
MLQSDQDRKIKYGRVRRYPDFGIQVVDRRHLHTSGLSNARAAPLRLEADKVVAVTWLQR